MNLQQFAAAHQHEWTSLHDLVTRAGGKPERLGTAEFAAVGRGYRSAVADLGYARRRFPGDPLTSHLDDLVRRSRALVYSNLEDRQGFWWFLHTGYWRRVRERPRQLLLAAVLLLGPLVAAGVWAHVDPIAAGRVMPEIARTSGQPAPETDKNFGGDQHVGFATIIFTNNIRVTVVAFAGGITLGLFTGYVLITNGLLVGLLGGSLIAQGQGSAFFQLVVPHGVLELSLIVVAGAAGFRVADAILRPGRRARGPHLVAEGRAAVEMMLGTAFWLIPCGIVEGFVTPSGYGLPTALVVGCSLGALFWTLVVWRGRPPLTDAPVP